MLTILYIVQDTDASSRTVSRRLLKLSTEKYIDDQSNKNSLILAHNEIGEQLWMRTVEGSGKYQVSSLPPNGTAMIKLPVTHSIQDSSQKKMVPGRSGKFVAMRIGDAEVKSSAAQLLALKFCNLFLSTSCHVTDSNNQTYLKCRVD